MNSSIIEKLVAAGVLSSNGIVNKGVLSTYALTHDILVVMYDRMVGGITLTYLRAVVEKWTFQDKAMGEQYITFDYISEEPVSWQIGDYCIFRGETYSLNYIPSVTQRSGRRKVMDAFKYESVKMDSYADELTRCEMLDVVLTSGQHDPDAGTNHTGSSSFQLFCGETTVDGVTRTAVMTLGDRILANLNRMYTGDKAWTIEYGPDTHTEDQMLSFSNQKVAQALAEVKNKFDLNYSIQGRTIKIGFELGGIADTNFGYGPGYNVEGDDGKGLFEIKKIADSSQQIVTRLRVLGSTKNLPYRYYNKSYDLPQALFPTNLQLPDTFLPVTGVPTKKRDGDPDNKTQGNSQRGTGTCQVKGDSNDAYIDKNDDASATVEGIREASIRFDGSDSKLKEIFPTIEDVTYDELRGANVPDQSGTQGQSAFPGYGSSEFINRILAIGYKSDGTMFDDANIGNGILSENGDTDSDTSRTPDINIPQRTDTDMTPEQDYYCGEEQILFTLTGVTQGKYFMAPVAGKEPWFVYTPNNPGTPVGYIIRVKQTISGVTNTIAVYKSDFVQGMSAIQLPSIPDAFFMDDAKVKEIDVTGTSTITVTFTPCTKRYNELIYRVGAKTLDAYTAEYVWSDLASMDSSAMPFHVFVKDMGFDFEAQFNGETPKIVMKSGQCVGREFTIGQNIEKVTYNGKAGYMLTLNRASDTSLNTYYPNARNQIAADDAFVIVGIDLPDAYIMAAEYRLLVAATEWLSENGDTHFRYQPSIDDIYLKRNYDNMVAAGTVEDSVFWKLYAGYKLPFIPIADGNSEPSAVSVTIESVSITMGESLTRKVEIVLNDELKESTLKRVTRDVENLSREMQSVGSGMSSAQMEYVARKAGDERYLSKVEDDTAEGDILFNGTIRFSKPAVFVSGAYFSEQEDGSFGAEIDPEGNIHSGKNIEADGGVSAQGIADLSLLEGGGGGGQGTVKAVQIGDEEPIEPNPETGVVSLPAYPDTTGLATRISDIESLIPTEAAPSNKLADKVWVTSQIPTALSQLTDDATHRLVTDSQITAWSAKYDKPSTGIPSTDLASSVQTSLGKADSAYQKPSTGIPATDMAQAVQTSLGKADTALQPSALDAYTPTANFKGLTIQGGSTTAVAYSPVGNSSPTLNIAAGSNINVSVSGATITIANTYSYTLPTASADTKGGVKVGTGLSISDAVLSVKIQDNLTSDSATDVLSAKQGKALKTIIDNLDVTDQVNGYVSKVDQSDGKISVTHASFAQAQIGHTGGTGTTAYQIRVKADGAWSNYFSLQVAGATQWGIITDQSQTIGGDKTFKGNVISERDIMADGGIAAFGVSDLSYVGGGGDGTVTGVKVGPSGEVNTPDSNGVVEIPPYPEVPSLSGYATESWVDQNYAVKATEGRVTNIENLIPTQATTSNQLADKAFVNSSIATNTATFRGTYESVADLPTSSQISDLKSNDYAFVIDVISDNPEYKRYKYNGTAWVYEYTLNNSSFTAAQWAAITSGITSALVTKLNGIETGAQVNKIEVIKLNGSTLTITNKTVDVSGVALTDGSNASGTWGISITGNAGTATAFSSARTIALSGDVSGSASSTGSSGWSITTAIGEKKVLTAMLNDSAVTTAKVNDGAITFAKLKAEASGVTDNAWTDTINATITQSNHKLATDYAVRDAINALDYTDSVNGDFVTSVSEADGKISIQKGSFSTPSASFTEATANQPILNLTVQGKSTTASVPLADASHSGMVSRTTQSFAGAKTFKAAVTMESTLAVVSHIQSTNGNIQALAGGVSATGIADLSYSEAGGGSGTVIAIRFRTTETYHQDDAYLYESDTNGIVNLPALTWGNIQSKPNFATIATSGSYNDLDVKIPNAGSATNPVYFSGGVAVACTYSLNTTVPSNAVFTDRYVNSASFADDSTNTAASPVKMTLTRAGSDSASITANIPKVSATSAGVAPKGSTVSSQSKTTKFLREDGTWAAPSYSVYTAGTSIDITNNVVKVSMAATTNPEPVGFGLDFVDSVSQNTAGKITVHRMSLQVAAIDKAGIVTTGDQTFAGIKTFSSIVVSSSLKPSSNNAVSLGTSSLRWSNIYGVGGDLSGALNVAGNITSTSGNIQATSGGVSAVGIADLAYSEGGSGGGTVIGVRFKTSETYQDNHIYPSDTNGIVDIPSMTWANVQSKPNFATVATSGSYNDLSVKIANAGSATNPVYFSGGVAVACTYSLNKTVPSDAVFTDHTYNFSGTTFYSGNSSNAGHDANSATANGHYYYSSNGPATSLGASTNDGALYVQSYSDGWVGQIAQDYRNGRLFVRGKNNGTWQSWLRVALFSEIPTLSTLTLSTTAQAYDGTHTLALPASDPYTSARTPSSHASTGTGYGVGTTSNYGHVKLATGDMKDASGADGVACGKNHTHSQYYLATNPNGYTTNTGTVTSITLKAGTGISLDVDNTAITTSGTRTITNTGVRSATINGNYLRVNTNGTDADLTIPYATSAGSATKDGSGNTITSTYLNKTTGGTLTGKLTISSGGIEVSGSSSSFHSSIYFDQGFGVASYDDDDESVSLLSYSTGNVAAIAYGNASKGVTRIFGKSLVLYTNGWNARVTIGEDGNVAFSGAISEGGTLISTKYTYTAGSYVDITSNAISVKEASSSQGGVVTNGTQTFAGDKTFGGITTFKKSTTSTTPLTVATSYSTGDNATRAAIKFEKNDGTAIGYIGCRIVDNVKEPYFNGGSYHTIWHDANSNLSTVDWACKDLSVAGTSTMSGAVTINNTATIKKTGSSTPLKLITASSDYANECDIIFKKNDSDETLLGYLGCRILTVNATTIKEPYFHDGNLGGYHTIWHDANSNLSTVDWAAKDLSVAGALGVTGNATLSGTTTMSNGISPLIIKNGNTSGSYRNYVSIKFQGNDGTDLGYIGARKFGTRIMPYYYDTGYHEIWHAGNSNLSTVDWACQNLNASGGVAAGGIADLTIY